MNVLNKFNDIPGLKLNKKKTKAMWIGSAKNNKTKPLGFQPYQEPIKSLGVNLSYQDRNNNLNFFVKIHKMDTKLRGSPAKSGPVHFASEKSFPLYLKGLVSK